MFDLFEEFAAVIDGLEKDAIPFAVCGGIAMSVHGFTRATEGIDLLIPPEELPRGAQTLARLGFTIKVLPMNFARGAMHIRRFSKADRDGDVLMVDLLLVTPQTKPAWDTRQTLMWRDRPLHAVSRKASFF